MRRAPAELRPLSRSTLALLLLLLACTRAAAAQSPPPAPDARALAAAEIGVTRLAGVWAPQTGGSLSLRLSRRVELGGAARLGLSTPTISRGGSSVRLHFGYAGARVTVLPDPERAPALRVGLLLGGGNADVDDARVGTLVDSDNGVVVEPSASWGVTLGPKVSASAALSWRFATRFRVLGGVRSRDLRGPAAGFAVTIGPW